ALTGKLAIKISAAVALSALAMIAFKSYRSSSDKVISGTNSTKQKELPSPETVRLPLRTEELHRLIYKYNSSQGLEAGLTIAKRWLKVHEKHAQREDKIAVYLLLARMYSDLHQNKGMEYFANKVFSDHDALRQSVAVTQYLAKCYLDERQPQKALERIEKTLDSQPIFKQKPPLSLLNAEANILIEMGDYNRAIKLLNTIGPEIEAPDSYGEFDSLAWRLTLISAYSKANKDSELKKAIAETIKFVKQQQPHSTIPLTAAYIDIAITLKKDGKNGEDILHYARLAAPILLQTKAFESVDSAEDIIGTTLQTQGKYTEAMAAYQLIANNNKYQQSFDRKAINFVHMYECSKLLGDYRSAESYILKSVQCVSDEYKASNAQSFKISTNVYWACISNLADFYISKAEYSKAEQLLSKWIELAMQNKIDPQIYALLCDKKCEVLFKTKNFSEAIKCADNAQKVLNDPLNEKKMPEETRMFSVLKTHIWKDMAFSFTKDAQASKRETSWVVQTLLSNKQIPTQTKVRYFIDFANVYYPCRQIDQADICCNEAEKLLLSSDSALNKEQLESYLQIAEFRSSRFQNSAAESMFRNVISRLNEIGQQQSVLMLRSKIGLSDVLDRQQKYKEAETIGLDALKLAKQLSLKNYLYYLSHRVILQAYFDNHEYQKAKQYAALGAEIAPVEFVTVAYCDEANACRKLQEFAEAEKLVNTALDRAQLCGRNKDEIRAMAALAEDTYAQLYLDQKMYQKALDHSSRAIELGEEAGSNGNKSYLAEAYHKKGSALTKLNRKAEAIPYLKKANNLFDSLQSKHNREKEDIALLMRMCNAEPESSK
ncbi:MAG: hypothetical protein K2X81_14105, partial [Candidatus Obscuribacterales bacterium]|nr:hypothetical protein [Candidatus Obscuribacterales bacterium]